MCLIRRCCSLKYFYLWKTDDMTDEISEISVNWLVSSAWYWKFWKISEVAKISGLFGKCSSNCRLNWKSSSTTNLLLFAVLTILSLRRIQANLGIRYCWDLIMVIISRGQLYPSGGLGPANFGFTEAIKFQNDTLFLKIN